MDADYKHSRREFSHILKQRASPPPGPGQVAGSTVVVVGGGGVLPKVLPGLSGVVSFFKLLFSNLFFLVFTEITF